MEIHEWQIWVAEREVHLFDSSVDALSFSLEHEPPLPILHVVRHKRDMLQSRSEGATDTSKNAVCGVEDGGLSAVSRRRKPGR